jgi:kynurenine formamidase
MKIGTLIDLTQPMYEGAPTMPSDPKLSLTWHGTTSTLGYNISRLVTSLHQGTHVDAARHFIDGGEGVGEIALSRLVTRAVVADLTGKAPGAPILPADLAPAEGALARGAAVLLRTGWDAKFPGEAYFSGFPYVTNELADWFVERGARLVGMDVPTPTNGDYRHVHLAMLGAGCVLLEGLVNLAAVPAGEEFTLIALPLKLPGRDGSPVRAVAMLDA